MSANSISSGVVCPGGRGSGGNTAGIVRACTMRLNLSLACAILAGALLLAGAVVSEVIAAPRDFRLDLAVQDRPSDDGSSLILSWSTDPAVLTLPTGVVLEDDPQIFIERKTEGAVDFLEAGRTTISAGRFQDIELDSRESYVYRIGLQPATGGMVYSEVSMAASPKGNLFRTQRVNALVAVLMMGGLVIAYIMAARRGAKLFIRRISGLDQIKEAVGRATEMGRKILFVPGIVSVSEPQTLAALGILGYVAKLTAQYGTQLEVPNADPLTMASAREIVKQSYMEAGAPEAFHEDMVRYITQDQFAYAGSVSGIMVRDKPAAIFLLGWFAAESLLLSETGQSIGAIQIAGTAQVTQLPFFVAACDYTMLGEELFAASAYLSKDPLILGSIKGQDAMKIAILAAIVIGVVMATVGADGFVNWFTAL